LIQNSKVARPGEIRPSDFPDPDFWPASQDWRSIATVVKFPVSENETARGLLEQNKQLRAPDDEWSSGFLRRALLFRQGEDITYRFASAAMV